MERYFGNSRDYSQSAGRKLTRDLEIPLLGTSKSRTRRRRRHERFKTEPYKQGTRCWLWEGKGVKADEGRFSSIASEFGGKRRQNARERNEKIAREESSEKDAAC